MRTHVVANELSKRLGDEALLRVNTGRITRQPLHTWMGLRKAFRQCQHIIMMPGRRGLTVLAPQYDRWRRKNGNRLHYLVVGGWLPAYLRQNPSVIRSLHACDGLYVQSERMLEELAGLGLSRLHLLPNFREFDRGRRVSVGTEVPLRLVFLSRVIPEKGVEHAVEAVKMVNEQAGGVVATLDIWGPVAEGDSAWLEQTLKGARPAVEYRGFLPPERIYAVLPDYDVMVFPTFYSGEGFPGVVVDAYVAGIPVIASDWHYNEEFVRDGHTGFIFRTGDVADLSRKIQAAVDDPRRINQMKHNAAERAALYHVDAVIPPLLSSMRLIEGGGEAVSVMAG